jgi:hypothetical protein
MYGEGPGCVDANQRKITNRHRPQGVRTAGAREYPRKERNCREIDPPVDPGMPGVPSEDIVGSSGAGTPATEGNGAN